MLKSGWNHGLLTTAWFHEQSTRKIEYKRSVEGLWFGCVAHRFVDSSFLFFFVSEVPWCGWHSSVTKLFYQSSRVQVSLRVNDLDHYVIHFCICLRY